MHSFSVLALASAAFVGSVDAATDPCAIATASKWVSATQAHACELNVPFNQSRSQVVIENVIKGLQYYSLENWFIKSPNPLIPHKVNIRALLENVQSNVASNLYKTDFDFNIAIADAFDQEHDGHTVFTPSCAASFSWNLPFSIATLADNVNDAVAYPTLFVNYDFPLQGRAGLEDYYKTVVGFNARKYDGLEVLTINGNNASQYLYNLADQSLIYNGLIGAYESLSPRYMRLMSRYSADTASGAYTQEVGRFGQRSFYPGATSISMVVQKKDGTTLSFTIPWAATFIASGNTTSSFIADTCLPAASSSNTVSRVVAPKGPRQGKAVVDPDAQEVMRQAAAAAATTTVNYVTPNLTSFGEKVVTIDIYQLKKHPKVGVVYFEQFEPEDGVTTFDEYFAGVSAALYTGLTELKAAGVKHILLDQSGNRGGYIMAGAIAMWSLWPQDLYPGFPAVFRDLDLARRESIISSGTNNSNSEYNYRFYRDLNYNLLQNNSQFMNPSIPQTINGVADAYSVPFFDDFGPSSAAVTNFTTPPFSGTDMVFVANSICASTCSIFSSYLYQKHGVRSAVFGGPPSAMRAQFDGGVKGSEVSSYAEALYELGLANLTGDAAAPQALPIKSSQTFNFRNAIPYIDKGEGILEFVYEEGTNKYQYTKQNFNDPQKIWEFVAEEFFGSK